LLRLVQSLKETMGGIKVHRDSISRN